MDIKTHQFNEQAGISLADPGTKALMSYFPVVIEALRDAAMQSFPDPDAAMARGAAIRAGSLARLPELLEEFEKNALANGARVFWARDAAKANEYVLNLAREKGVNLVTKGKSMITEETGLNESLEAADVTTHETDLGEFITQMMHRPPFHIVGPAINVPAEEIRDLFMEKIGLTKPTTDPSELGYAARLFLRDRFKNAGLGVTGVNMAVAETGAVINVENEGNIRFCKSSPRIQVSIMSLEKVVPSMREAMHMLRLLCRSCTGQKLGSYVTVDCGPRKSDEADGPEELHIIILDNGRTNIYRDVHMREALQCVRCGACSNACPVYRQIGGYPYGWVYSGAIGMVLNSLLLGLDRTHDLFCASTLCHACKSVCPAGIDHPKLLLRLRSRDVQGDPGLKGRRPPWTERWKYRMFGLATRHPGLWRAGVRLARTPVMRRARRGAAPVQTGRLGAWLRRRDLPIMPRRTFRDRWSNLRSRF